MIIPRFLQVVLREKLLSGKFDHSGEAEGSNVELNIVGVAPCNVVGIGENFRVHLLDPLCDAPVTTKDVKKHSDLCLRGRAHPSVYLLIDQTAWNTISVCFREAQNTRLVRPSTYPSFAWVVWTRRMWIK